jgi:hypothetical protein
MTKSVASFVNEVKKFLTQNGFEVDRFGHYIKSGVRQIQKPEGTVADKYVHRYVFQKTSLRLESKVFYSDGSTGWVRIASGYYSALSLSQEKGSDKIKLFGMKR